MHYTLRFEEHESGPQEEHAPVNLNTTHRREHVDHPEREPSDHGHAPEIEGRNHLLTQVQEGPIIAGQLIDASGINEGWSNSVPVGSWQACNRRRLCSESVE